MKRTAKPRRLREAATREGMVSVNVWLPEALHRRLARVRAEEGIATSEAIREAVRDWFKRRAAARKGGKP
jgi:metal-responsive CopG/Arc/MetJ family transcriptional regulator